MVLYLHQTLQLGQFEDADFKCDNRFLKTLPKTPKWDISRQFLLLHKRLKF